MHSHYSMKCATCMRNYCGHCAGSLVFVWLSMRFDPRALETGVAATAAEAPLCMPKGWQWIFPKAVPRSCGFYTGHNTFYGPERYSKSFYDKVP